MQSEQVEASPVVRPKDRWWQHLHWPEYGAELLGTAFLVFVGLSAVVFNFGKGLPMATWLPDPAWRRLLTGLIFAGSGALVAISPAGKLSGAHINPSVSLAFWVQGKMHHRDVIGYVLAQLLGGLFGAILLSIVWGQYASSVHDGMTLPGVGYPLWLVFLGEVSLTGLLVFAIFFFVSHTRLMRWTPLMTWFLVAAMVWLEAPLSGTSLNPARSLGPAIVSWLWQTQWLYCIAPPLGALLAVGVYRLLGLLWTEQDLLTGKLFHSSEYRSIFKHVSALHKAPVQH